MNKQLVRYGSTSLLVLDFIMLNVMIALSRMMFVSKIPDGYAASYMYYLVSANLAWLILSWISALYSQRAISSFEVFSKRTVQVYVVWICWLMIYLFFSRQFLISRFFIFSSLSFFAVGIAGNRFVFLGIKNYYKENLHLSKKVIILGYNEVAKRLASYLERESGNVQIVGYVDELANITELTHYPILSSMEHALSVSKELEVNEIISTITPEQDHKVFDLMHEAEAECIRFKIVPDLSYFIDRRMHIDFIKDMPLISLRSEPLEDLGNRAKKRAIDVVVSSLVILFVLSWLLPLIALLIKSESKGPVLFKQLRTGKNNRSFACFKFRSMKVNCDADHKQAVKNDQRLTLIGKFLRKTSLDEFPQFFNVFKGEMSLVGPRPHMLKHTENYAKLVDQYMIRQFLKPGITGWAQVNGYRGEIHGNEQIKDRVAHDIWYSENWSLWLDIRILFLTVYKVILGDKQAY